MRAGMPSPSKININTLEKRERKTREKEETPERLQLILPSTASEEEARLLDRRVWACDASPLPLVEYPFSQLRSASHST